MDNSTTAGKKAITIIMLIIIDIILYMLIFMILAKLTPSVHSSNVGVGIGVMLELILKAYYILSIIFIVAALGAIFWGWKKRAIYNTIFILMPYLLFSFVLLSPL